jgi:hypothetical protein
MEDLPSLSTELRRRYSMLQPPDAYESFFSSDDETNWESTYAFSSDGKSGLDVDDDWHQFSFAPSGSTLMGLIKSPCKLSWSTVIRFRLRFAVLRTAPRCQGIVILFCLAWGPRDQMNIATNSHRRESRGILFVVSWNAPHATPMRHATGSSHPFYPLHLILEGFRLIPFVILAIIHSPCNDLLNLMNVA